MSRLRTPLRAVLFSLLFISQPGSELSAQTDSTAIYRKIHDYSQKRKVTRWIYEAIFEAPQTDRKPPAPKTPPRRVNAAERYQGKIVRNIRITVTDPFGFSVDDTTKVPKSGLQKAGNRLHRRTRDYVIRDLLLVHANDTLDPLSIAESERLLRASAVVNDARITVRRIPGNRDSVDVDVVVHDKWNYAAFGRASLSAVNATLLDRNVLGLGQELQQQIIYGPRYDDPELSGQYRVYNIRKTYISSLLQYSTTAATDQLGLRFDRPFYSPLARMAGALSLGKTWNRTTILDSLGTELGVQRLDPITFDTWIGRSFPVANDGTDPGRSSNIIGGLRYFQTRYARRPTFTQDTLRVNSNVSTFLAGAGFSVRQYYKERYLFRFGATEDVPEGLLLKVTGGIRKREELRSLLYSGIEGSRGRYYTDLGYTSVFAGYGTFWEGGKSVDATFRAGFLYFSDLLSVGQWHFRQFVRGTVVKGFGKPAYSRINLNGDQLYGFNSEVVSGTHKELLTFETVAYAPFNILGFRFAPILLYGLGTIGEEGDALFSGRIYNALGLGILIRNENLLVSTFEVSFSFFPFQPETGAARFDSGSFTSFSVKAQDFSFTQPDVIGYY